MPRGREEEEAVFRHFRPATLPGPERAQVASGRRAGEIDDENIEVGADFRLVLRLRFVLLCGAFFAGALAAASSVAGSSKVSPGPRIVPSVPTLAWWPVVKTIASSVPSQSASSASSWRWSVSVPLSSREPVSPVP